MNRLFEILYIILNKKTVTANELSKHFEVSERTIYRDIDTLCMAGIPIYTKKGKNGGISILDNYVLNRALISEEEKLQIISALMSIQEVEKGNSDATLKKISSIFDIDYPNWISIDFSDWSNQKQELFVQLKEAILKRNLLTFDYYDRLGNITTRTVEPLQLWFKSSTWYLRAYCRTKCDVRTFKVVRMQRVKCLEETFELRKLSEFANTKTQSDPFQMDVPTVVLHIDASQAYRVYDSFDENEIVQNEDGSFTVTLNFNIDDWVYGMILSYGPYATVVYPEIVRNEIVRRLKNSLENY